jgi:hypothetical protein
VGARGRNPKSYLGEGGPYGREAAERGRIEHRAGTRDRNSLEVGLGNGFEGAVAMSWASTQAGE